MNKKLMAVAVAGALAAPALAFAQASTVQLYGKLTYEYGYAKQGGNRIKTDVAQTPGGSAIGFKGEEKLGGGLSAWFQCESSADVRGISQNGFCTRNSAIGLKGAFGNLHFGRWDSPFKRAINMGTVGVQDTGLLGHSFLLTGGSQGTNATTASNRNVWKRRDVGWAYYESPNYMGFQALAGVTTGNGGINKTDGVNNDTPRVMSVAGIYSNGPIALGAGYERHNDFAAGAALPEGNDDAWNVSGAYTYTSPLVGKVKVGVAYINEYYNFGAGKHTSKHNLNAGVDWSIAGPHGVELGYTQAGNSKGNGTTVIGDIAAAGGDTGARLYAIKYRYSFSKRTDVRFGYVKLNNDVKAAYALGGLTGKTNADQSAWVMYAQHAF